MTTLYGIPSCDSCRKARRWLDANQVQYRFHDLRSDGLDAGMVRQWCDELGWEALLNRRSTTWRALQPHQREGIDAAGAQALMLASPTLIKRPVIAHQGNLYVGFQPDAFGAIFD